MTVLRKENKGIRQIAVRNILRSLATKWELRLCAQQVLRPVILWISSKSGCKPEVEYSHRQLVFKIDMTNAYISLRLQVFLFAALKEARALYRLLCYSHSRSINVFYGDAKAGGHYRLTLFSRGFHCLNRDYKTQFNDWYLFDVTSRFHQKENLVGDLWEVGVKLNTGK